ncbi:MAG: D-alanyl-D-alanine carboxypeptidase/D-alanyl-D-alanine-endopeptidase [bacterium]
MPNCKWMLLPLLLLLNACASRTKIAAPDLPINSVSALHERLDTILQDSALAQSTVGVKVIALKTDEVLYEKNSRLLFHPASNMKLFTTAAALKNLGPNYKFPTILYADTTAVADSVVHGNLYLKGFANPDLTTEDLRWMAQQLKSQGIKKITGDLICDDSYLDDFYWGWGWMWDDVSAWEWAPISALTVEDNCVEVKVKPGQKVGDSLIVQMEPQTAFMKIVNYGVTVDSTDTTRIDAFKVERIWRPLPENTVVIEGGRTQKARPREFTIDVVNAPLYAGTLLAELLLKEGLEFKGQILNGTAPDTTMLLVKHLSAPLTEIVMNTNKVSDNLSAELLLKTLGAEIYGVPGTAKKGFYAINKFMHEIGADTTSYKLADGSGVSRYGTNTADNILALLKAMYRDFQVQAEFMASLSIAGVDGTLKNRMHGTAADGKVRAKTGNLRGVSALSGFTSTAYGEPIAFSMLMAHFLGSSSKIKKIQDRVAVALSEFRWKSSIGASVLSK